MIIHFLNCTASPFKSHRAVHPKYSIGLAPLDVTAIVHHACFHDYTTAEPRIITVEITTSPRSGDPRAPAPTSGIAAIWSPSTTRPPGPCPLGPPLPTVERLARFARDRPACHCSRLAPQGISPLLEMEESEARTAASSARDENSHPPNVARESNVGSAQDTGRIVEARD